MYTAGYGATATGAGIQRIKQVDLPHAHCIGAGLEMAAAATADGIYVWGLLRTPDGLRHIARPERIPTDGPGPRIQRASNDGHRNPYRMIRPRRSSAMGNASLAADPSLENR